MNHWVNHMNDVCDVRSTFPVADECLPRQDQTHGDPPRTGSPRERLGRSACDPGVQPCAGALVAGPWAQRSGGGPSAGWGSRRPRSAGLAAGGFIGNVRRWCAVRHAPATDLDPLGDLEPRRAAEPLPLSGAPAAELAHLDAPDPETSGRRPAGGVSAIRRLRARRSPAAAVQAAAQGAPPGGFECSSA